MLLYFCLISLTKVQQEKEVKQIIIDKTPDQLKFAVRHP